MGSDAIALDFLKELDSTDLLDKTWAFIQNTYINNLFERYWSPVYIQGLLQRIVKTSEATKKDYFVTKFWKKARTWKFSKI